MSSNKKVNLNSVADLRQNTDDNLPAALEGLGYEESFKLVDTKIALGLSTVAIAGGLFAIDKKYDFKESYWITVAALAVYFVISLVMLVVNNQNKNVKYIGYSSKGKKITIAAWTTKYDPIYHVKVTFNDDPKSTTTAELPFAKFFDLTGYFSRNAFSKLLSSHIEKIEKKDI
ncbi:predicted protein [Scheffersomyces stipitis CBS 6054]|uniref:Signal peptidase complex subunit 2 n=1 Tax=Scheffersomyces stipitis (strain ATCC 58785 / CBS 6054 / NBRC 10063 / NRRL Y-11545) TaxID=322104 RepID=A3LSW1_PICST|nr:predicted protein [Scheffersomyces stipitis CBS 6054]ABN66300.2 predicted protein [Scheffersomyces stipitis CBS 6054]KAG2733360.1 hypothetical protein G9P44_004350 [Scheffersomyces stipitis]